MGVSWPGYPQETEGAFLKILSHDYVYDYHFYSKEGRNSVSFLQLDRKETLLSKIVGLPIGALMFGYQNFMSGQISSGCGFETTCSNFAKHAFQKYNVVAALLISMDRIYRCNSSTHRNAHHFELNHEGKIIEALP